MEVDDETPEFTLAEVIEMEKLYKAYGEKAISREFCEEVATRFSSSSHRDGKPCVVWEQVQTWFQIKERNLKTKNIVPPACYRRTIALNAALAKKREKEPTISASEAAAELPGLRFEARSAKDYCWFDVGSFLAYKVLNSGELVARVRFSGFGTEEDEWVNVKQAVRERSIPLEHSECDRVNVGDLVLCFREVECAALYCDAYVVNIKREVHDSNKCTCVFVVRYELDNAEEEVSLDKLCCRPTQSVSKGIFKPKDVKEEMEMFSW